MSFGFINNYDESLKSGKGKNNVSISRTLGIISFLFGLLISHPYF